jgi:hypothetical protein
VYEEPRNRRVGHSCFSDPRNLLQHKETLLKAILTHPNLKLGKTALAFEASMDNVTIGVGSGWDHLFLRSATSTTKKLSEAN